MSAAVATRPRGRGKARASLELIDAAREILKETQPASVRAVGYRLLALGLIPNMSKGSTNRVGAQLTWAREQGMIPWEWIADATRTIDRPNTWDSPDQLLRASAHQYRRDWWEQQQVRVLLCSEKSTVAGTVRPVTEQYGVGFLSLHGYSSTTSAHDVAELSIEDERELVLFYIGDWDPSGMDMSERDLPRRIGRYGGLATVERIALTAADIADPHLTSFSAHDKRKDARHPWFVQQYGVRCWELDTLNPNILRERVEDRIRSLIDWDAWVRCERVEKAERASLLEVVGTWKGAR